MNNKQHTISILGCGWYGLELAKHLRSKNYPVKGSTTSPEKIPLLKQEGILPYLVNFQEDQISYHPDFFISSTLIIAIPPKRNTAEQATFLKKIAAISNAAKNQIIENVIFISSTAVYANENETITESTSPNPETASGKAILASEKLLQSRQEFTTTILRFAGLIGPGRDPGRFFAGKKDIPNGMSPINLIHLKDCVEITMQIITQNAFGNIFNACTPHHPSKQDFYRQASVKSGLIEPIFIDELNAWKIISSDRIPTILKYKYLIDNWTDWLAEDKL